MTPRPTPYRAALLGVLAIAVALRVPGLAGDLWLDEIWSLKNALDAASWRDIFLSLKTDNNHHLVSLWLRALGPMAPSVLYRLPSLITGVASVGVAAWTVRRDGAGAGIVTALLFALSYPLVYYASEARGYAPVVFLSLAAWFCLREYLDTERREYLGLFWIGCALGVMTHVTFVEAFLGALVWCDTHLQRQRRSLRSATRTTALLFVPPGVFIAAFYWIALRGTSVAGGPPSVAAVVTAQTLSLLVSGPLSGPGMWIAAAATGLLLIACLAAMIRGGDDRWIMVCVTAVALPVLLRVVHPEGPLYPRYLLVPGTFVLLAIGPLLARWLEDSSRRRFTAALVLTLSCSGSILHVLELGTFGRGRFERAVAHMLATPDPDVTVSSRADYSLNDDRVAMMIEHYARRLPGGDRIRYVSARRDPTRSAGWMIVEEIQGAGEPAKDLVIDVEGRQYLLEGEYRSSALTGIAWRLYRRVGS